MSDDDDLPTYPGNIDSFDDLQEAFRWVEGQGYVPAISGGPHAVGTTLEIMLNHALDADSASDFGFTELKAQRSGTSSPTTLFTKEPSYNEGWSMRRVIEEHGYEDDDGQLALRINLYSHDNWGLYLEADSSSLSLMSSEHGELGSWDESDMEIGMEKISDVCYISADSESGDSGEMFHYNSFSRLILPDDFDFSDFLGLIDEGSVSVEIRAYIRHSGEVRNHGCGFRSPDIMSISCYEWEDLT
jgi:hypothetical protein